MLVFAPGAPPGVSAPLSSFSELNPAHLAPVASGDTAPPAPPADSSTGMFGHTAQDIVVLPSSASAQGVVNIDTAHVLEIGEFPHPNPTEQ
jgi:hypothetical protein